MAWSTWYDWTAGDTATASRMDQIATNIRALIPVGAIQYAVRSATSVETLVDSCWLECNGVAVSRTTYSSLNTLLSGLSYPFGTGDGSTTFNLPDLRGRTLVAMAASGHSDVNGLNDSDGVSSVGSRTPKAAAHTHTGGTHSHSISGSPGAGGTSNNFDEGSTPVLTSVTAGTLGVSSASAGTTGSGGAYSGSFLVAGVWLIKAVD